MPMFFRAGTLAVAALVAASCGGPTPTPEPSPVAGTPRVTTPVPADAPVVSAAPVPGASLTGAQVVEQVCGQCHSLEPPPLKAPPLTHLSRHLRDAFADEDAAVDFVVAWATAPDSTRSILPPMARERVGLMPPQPLPADLLEAAARYVWSLGAGEATESGMGHGMGPGMGGGMSGMGMHRHGGGMTMEPGGDAAERPGMRMMRMHGGMGAGRGSGGGG